MIIDRLVTGLGERFTMRPWNTVFQNGDNFLERLVTEANSVDAAIFVFARDDRRDIRGRSDYTTRDNVVLEYGLFLGLLGKERIYVLRESGVEMPTDLAGLASTSFSAEDDVQLQAFLNIAVDGIKNRWSDLKRREGTDVQKEMADGSLGLSRTLNSANKQRRAIEDALKAWLQPTPTISTHAFAFDSSSSAREAYIEALNLVSNRFWTTTYLSSGFWTTSDVELIAANRKLLNRLRANQGVAKRLVVLSKASEDELEERRQRLMYFRQQKDQRAIDELKRGFRNLQRAFVELRDLGCEVRVAFDDGSEHRTLPNVLNFEAHDSEIAIYDSFRVDVFGGGRFGKITDLKVFCSATFEFDTILRQSENYFATLWETAQPSEEFLGNLEKAYDRAEKRIDYTSNWLAIYEFALDPVDAKLKTIEIALVEAKLRKHGRWGNLHHYLDVGTCTARYPIELRKAMASGGTILAIDDDEDCIRFAESCIERRMKSEAQEPGAHDAASQSRIALIKFDFSSPEFRVREHHHRFDLITCMLGTLSHFGWKRNNRPDDSLQLALTRFYELLTDDGLLFLSLWSEDACQNKRMLGIYPPHDVERLAQWTPRLAELRRRLLLAGLEIVDEEQPETRLDFFICKRSMGA